MQRISNEDGMSAGFRNVGRFFLAMVPWALAVGAMAWLGTWVAFHEWQRLARQEKRAAIYVGAPGPIKSKIKITALRRSCVVVDKADLDGSDLIVYASAEITCRASGSTAYAEWHWQELSPNGYILHQDWRNNVDIAPGEKAEFIFHNLPIDDRVAELQVWVGR